jgi:serine/threonine protein kinase
MCVETEQCGFRVPVTLHACMKPDTQWGMHRDEPLYRGMPYLINLPLLAELGSGAFSTVHKVVTPSGETAAVKTIPCGTNDLTYAVNMTVVHEMEARNFSDVNINGICRAEFVLPTAAAPDALFKMEMDVAFGTMDDLINQHTLEQTQQHLPSLFTPIEAKFLAYQIVRGMAIMHSRLLCNFDIKPDNVLVYAIPATPLLAQLLQKPTCTQLCISDLGLSVGHYSDPVSTPRAFILFHRPPETLFANTLGTPFGDIWATGVLLYFLAKGTLPFIGYDEPSIRKAIVDNFGTAMFFDKKNAQWFPKAGAAFWRDVNFPGSVTPKFKDRLDRELADYPGLAALLLRMLNPVPPARCTMYEAFTDPYFDDQTRAMFNEAFPRAPMPTRIRYTPFLSVVSEDALQVQHEMEHLLWDSHLSALSSADQSDHEVYDREAVHISRLIATTLDDTRQMLECLAMSILLKYLATHQHRPAPRISPIDAVAALQLADKYSSPIPLLSGTMDGIPRPAVFQHECSVLTGVDFDVTMPTAVDFMRLYLKRSYAVPIPGSIDPKIYYAKWTNAWQLLHMCLLDSRVVFAFPRPSELAELCHKAVMETTTVPPARMEYVFNAIRKYDQNARLHGSKENYSHWAYFLETYSPKK